MTITTIRTAVNACFLDKAVSVGEATVSLVGGFFLRSPKSIAAYQNLLLGRLQDKAVSVRKRVVQTFQEVLLHQSSFKDRAATCTKFVQRVFLPQRGGDNPRSHLRSVPGVVVRQRQGSYCPPSQWYGRG